MRPIASNPPLPEHHLQTPVSYTHLDVYKRQGIDWPLQEVSLSGKDQQNQQLAAQRSEDLPVYEG